MKRKLLATTLMALSLAATAQTFELQDQKGTPYTSGEIFELDSYPDSTLTSHMLIKNTGATDLDIEIHRYDDMLNKLEGEDTAYAYFCTGIICLTPEQVHTTINLAAGDTISFTHYFKEASNIGLSTVRYKFSVGNNEQMYSYVYNKTLGVEENLGARFNLYPNPSTSVINVQTATGRKIDVIEIRNLQGALVRSVAVNADAYSLGTTELPSGMYFLTVKSGAGKHTEKLQVIH